MTVVVALVSEEFVASVQQASYTLGMTPAFVGFIGVLLIIAYLVFAMIFIYYPLRWVEGEIDDG